MREIDRVTVEEIGIPETILMENAGLAIVDAIRSQYPDLTNLKVSLFAGKGNNGGDGSVAARLLYNLGASPTLFLLAKREELKGDAKLNADIFVSIGGALKEITQQRHLNAFKLKFMHSTVVVDALLGTGLKSEPHGLYGDVVDLMNKYGEYKVAVDVPTGINVDTGLVFGKHFVADATACLGARKLGLYMPPAREATGAVRFYDISIPVRVVTDSPCSAWLIEDDDIKALMPGRPADGHKGVFGHLALACGSAGMGGAAALAGMGALRLGAGLVTACLPQNLAQGFEAGCKEVMTVDLDSTDTGAIAASAADRFIEFAQGKTAILMGPGLGKEPSTKSFAHRVIQETDIPMVIDADGLNLLGRDSQLLINRKSTTIITPHPGEMARLTGKTIAQIQSDRVKSASEYAKKTGAVVVLKGAATIIALPDGENYLIPTGNHGLASGGTGDVLAGMIAGLLAQGAKPVNAAICGAYIHGKAADVYARHFDPRSLIASDLLDILPETLALF